jgi:hypothetical protein
MVAFTIPESVVGPHYSSRDEQWDKYQRSPVSSHGRPMGTHFASSSSSWFRDSDRAKAAPMEFGPVRSGLGDMIET